MREVFASTKPDGTQSYFKARLPFVPSRINRYEAGYDDTACLLASDKPQCTVPWAGWPLGPPELRAAQ